MSVGPHQRHHRHQPRCCGLLDPDGQRQSEVVAGHVGDGARQQLAGRLVQQLVRGHEVPQLHGNAAGAGLNETQRRLVNQLAGIDGPIAENRCSD